MKILLNYFCKNKKRRIIIYIIKKIGPKKNSIGFIFPINDYLDKKNGSTRICCFSGSTGIAYFFLIGIFTHVQDLVQTKNLNWVIFKMVHNNLEEITARNYV